MDYKRIYAEFIKDRRAKESTLTGYSERHHIVPRSMGGGDDVENLISLTPEDHFFAHLVLAKAHNTRPAWGAVMLMLGAKHAGAGRFILRRKATRWRSNYGAFKRAYSLASQGINGANADHDEYEFHHHSGKFFKGTRIAFADFSGVSSANINPVIRGRTVATAGWALSKETAVSAEVERKKRLSVAGRSLKGFTRCPDLYCFHHVETGRCIIGTQRGMKEMRLLDKNSVSALCNGKRYLAKGWCLIENAGWAADRANKRGKYCAAFISRKYDFVNAVTGESKTATIWEMGQMFGGGDSRPFGELVRAKKRGFRGWHLKGSAVPRTTKLVHQIKCRSTGALASGTQSEIVEILGVTQSAISGLVSRRVGHVKGWVLVEEKGADARAA
jgi:hypothetical protein